MARFFGKIGYAVDAEEVRPGVYTEDVIVEKPYYGDILSVSRKLDVSEKVIPDLFVDNRISIVADAYANENFTAMRYVQWLGKNWVVSTVKVEAPRLILSLGGVYNGPVAGNSGSDDA